MNFLIKFLCVLFNSGYVLNHVVAKETKNKNGCRFNKEMIAKNRSSSESFTCILN
ncbi:hypothetical protein GCM10007103_09280 [Salinimicrobium marinum]|uniref:Uncharacterized protein n=1 Tax=Salinimicrobium marinum TaxID=680283 RepID=A0A918S9P6_9FLAO|nr:hypothetical protein GCM10007103_09280 [Salinimicrobium marinum]